MSDELKPCPSCESDFVGTTNPDQGWCHVFCGGCCMRGPSRKTVEEADAAWNALPRNPVPPAPKRGVAAIIGQWPGDETDEEIERAAAEVDARPAVGPATRDVLDQVARSLRKEPPSPYFKFGWRPTYAVVVEDPKAFLAEMGDE